jgi:hypothetical protein
LINPPRSAMDLLCICVSKFLSEPARSTMRSSPGTEPTEPEGKCNSKMQCDLEDASWATDPKVKKWRMCRIYGICITIVGWE